MDFFDIISFNERIIVYTSVEDRLLYTWNQSDTFQCYAMKLDGSWVEIAIMTQSGYGPKTFEQAKKVAYDWHFDRI